MPFNFQLAQASETSRGSRTFKSGVNYTYFRADEKRPLTFRILPAFSSHPTNAAIEDKAHDYVPAVSIVNGYPTPSNWMSAILMSRPFIKGSFPIVSRKSLIEQNADGTFVEQEDPLSKVIAYCKTYDKQWGYIVTDQGAFNSSNRILAKLPPIKPQYIMNVVTLDDDRPGVKLAVISSVTAINCLISATEGKEGIAYRQTTRELSQSEIMEDPSCIFMYGDITNPNSAPIFKFFMGHSDDGGRKVYQITPATEMDPSTGRKRLSRMPVTEDDMAQRLDLEHIETFVNIPTVSEQIAQIVQTCSGRNADGYHEYDMLRHVLPDYAEIIPSAPPAPGAINSVTGFTEENQHTLSEAPKAFEKAANENVTQAPRFTPKTQAQQQPQYRPTQPPTQYHPKQNQTTQPQATQPQQQRQQPKQQTQNAVQPPPFVPRSNNNYSEEIERESIANDGAGIPGESINFDPDDWIASAVNGGN